MSIVQATKGSYDFAVGNSKTENTGEGGFFIAPANFQQTIVHNNNPALKEFECRYIFFKVYINHTHLLEDFYEFPQILPKKYNNEMNLIFNNIFSAENKFEEYSNYCKAVEILSKIMKPKENPLPKEIENVIEFIT